MGIRVGETGDPSAAATLASGGQELPLLRLVTGRGMSVAASLVSQLLLMLNGKKKMCSFALLCLFFIYLFSCFHIPKWFSLWGMVWARFMLKI